MTQREQSSSESPAVPDDAPASEAHIRSRADAWAARWPGVYALYNDYALGLSVHAFTSGPAARGNLHPGPYGELPTPSHTWDLLVPATVSVSAKTMEASGRRNPPFRVNLIDLHMIERRLFEIFEPGAIEESQTS